jgi:purine-binding chemotaxis protein CheW
LKTDEIVPSPTIGTKYNSTFIEGLWPVNENFIMILDIDKIFSVDEVINFQVYFSENANE